MAQGSSQAAPGEGSSRAELPELACKARHRGNTAHSVRQAGWLPSTDIEFCVWSYAAAPVLNLCSIDKDKVQLV